MTEQEDKEEPAHMRVYPDDVETLELRLVIVATGRHGRREMHCVARAEVQPGDVLRLTSTGIERMDVAARVVETEKT